MKTRHSRSLTMRTVAACILLAVIPTPFAAQQKASREAAQFTIYIGGKEIGREKFSIEVTGDSAGSSSTLTYSDPRNKGEGGKLETELKMDSRFVPREYQLRADIHGRKETMKGTFGPGEAKFEYLAGGSVRRTGLMVGGNYTVLDTNVFHHFIFIGRLFDFESGEKLQSMEVVIPQELDTGLLKVSDLGIDEVSIRGKKRSLHHLRADTGSVQIDLWIDDERLLHKLSLPAKQIEVIRN